MNIVAPRLAIVRREREWRVEGNKIRY